MTERPFDITTGIDCVEWLSRIDDGSVHLAVTDPAYESLEKHRAKGTTTRLAHSDASSNDWFTIFRNERFPELMRELYRVLVDDAHLYVMCDAETSHVIRPIAQQVGFTWWNDLPWVKTGKPVAAEDLTDDDVRIGMGYHYRRAHELVCFFEKGKRRLNDLSIADVLCFPSVRGAYPTEKPVGLCRVLVEQSTQPGELVIDPFMGSGSTGEAALISGRRFAGCDLREKTPALERLRDFGTPAELLRARTHVQGRLFG